MRSGYDSISFFIIIIIILLVFVASYIDIGSYCACTYLILYRKLHKPRLWNQLFMTNTAFKCEYKTERQKVWHSNISPKVHIILFYAD